MSDVINGVPRELLERISSVMDNYVTHETREEDELRALLTAQPSGRVPELWSKSLGSCWPTDEDYPQGDWSIGTVDEDGNRYEVVRVEASQYDAEGESRKIAEAIVRLWAAAPAQPAAQREWPDDEIVAAWKWCEENGGTPAEFLSHSLLVKRSRVLGRPLTWREAIELTAITTSMPDEQRDKLLAIDDEPDAAAQDQGEVQRLREALEIAENCLHYNTPPETKELIRAAIAASTGQEVKP